MTLPASLVWEVTGRCSLACQHCYNIWSQDDHPPAELSPKERLAIVARLAPHHRALKALTLSGGEPLLLPDLEELIHAARTALPRIRINVSTNGLLLSPDRARALSEAGASGVQLTLLSARPEVHDQLVGQQGAQDRVLAALAGAREAGLVVAAFFVATRENIEGFPGAAKLALALGADVVVFNRFHPGGRGLLRWRELTPTTDQLRRAAAQILELRDTAPVPLGTPLPSCEGEGLEVLRCPIGTRSAYPCIGPGGHLRPCNHFTVKGGSLLEQPLDRLLQQPLFRLPKAALPDECAGCDDSGCGGGCPAARALARRPIYGL